MTHPAEEPRSTYYQAFVRDGHKCVYCGKDILESFDSFSASHLDHLKPRKENGPCEDVWNRVTACGVCNNLKGSYDPVPGAMVTEDNFAEAVAAAREYIRQKRSGETATSYYRDYEYWLKESGRNAGQA
ncbi:HNH endonuclease [Dokdonella sp.]|uniref:HNH endonuclease n=1 Tax=Dokdonella sp. TaxID=2291710 RepID=UPI0025BB9D8B|nr:HNH endonuclease [Dokdonella sp.]MBX3690449.1 HNH endonuclease [Dokdonella sp.]